MGTLVAAAIVWWFASRSEEKDTRRKQRRVFGLAMLGAVGWFLDSIFNADKYQQY